MQHIYPFKMETTHHHPAPQKAINHEGRIPGRKQQLPASFPFAPQQFPEARRTEEDENISTLIERARVQERCKRSAARELQAQLDFEAGLYARYDLSSHIAQSLPWRPRASQTILQKFWFSIHYEVAVFALNQAHKSALRLGLKRVVDKKHFLAENCRWYVVFCRCSCWLTSSFA